jgi:phenylpropionate dioxygenase-like ring-hydroxylating dioxygenase large terminal subunit
MEGTTATPPNRSPEVMALLGRLAEIARMDVKAATGLPPGLYTSQAFHVAEQTALFEDGWLCVGRSEDVPAPGDYLVSDIGNLSLATMRGQDGVVRNLANTCLHRMNPTIAPVAERLRPIEPVIARYRATGYGKVLDLDMVSDANWKLIHENFMETYHLPFVHRTSLGKQESIGVATGFDASDAYSIHRTIKHLDSPRGIAHRSNDVLTGEWRRTTVVLSVFPSLLLILCPDHLWYLLTHPMDAGRTRVVFGLSYAPEVLADVGAETLADTWRPYYDNLNAEDRSIVESIQKAARSPLAAPGRLSPLERFTLDLARYLVSGLGRVR